MPVVQQILRATQRVSHTHSFDELNLPSTASQSQSSQDQMAPARPQGLEFVGSKVKLLVDGISELRKFGLQHVVALPELVLVGDQSAGKSSLMSALTEVKLPRDQGICTKCPANIKTSPAETWSCKISLQQEYRYSPSNRITEATVTKNNPFPPWVTQDLEEKLFMVTENKDDLEDGIKWAQLALLNHNTGSFLLFDFILSCSLHRCDIGCTR